MNLIRIAIFSGLLIAGLLTGLLLRSGSSEPTSAHRGHTSGHPSSRSDASMTANESPDASKRPSRPGPAVDETIAMSMGVHPVRNATCPIMGNPTTADSFSILYNGLLVRFCCPGCDESFLADPLRHLESMKSGGASVPDEALAKSANPDVVMVENKVCPVTGKAMRRLTAVKLRRLMEREAQAVDC